MTSQQGQIELDKAAGRVQSRICLVNFLGWLAAGWWIAALAAIGAVFAVRYLAGWREEALWLAAGILGVWLAGGLIRMFFHRPDRLGALSIWDERGGWKDLFSSAWFFSGNPEIPEGEKWHLSRAMKALPGAVKKIAGVFPVPKVSPALVMIPLVLAVAWVPYFYPAQDAGDTELTPEMLAEAEKQAAELEREKEQVDQLDGLNQEERKQLEKIKDTVDGAVDDLADSEGKTAREVLEALEARARAAERLAAKLGSSSDEWASEEMLREMGRHADTADLASSIKDKSAENAAVEADAVAEALNQPELKLETQNRMTTALDLTMQKATDDDHKKPVGERVGNASRKMEAKQPRTAAREFEELAKHFRLVKQREEAKEKLQKLAEKLREAGSSISGSKLQKMQQLAGSKSGQQAPNGLQPLSNNPLQNQPGVTPMAGTPSQTGQPGAKGAGQMPIPGAQNPNGQGQQQGKGGLAMPVPGTGQQGKQGLAAGQPGGKGGQKGSGLFAPIPGMKGKPGSPGAGLGAAGAGAGSAAPGNNGGLQAGAGTAPLGAQATESIKAPQTSKVAAQINEDGDSTFQAVQGRTHSEQSRLEQQEVIVNFIKVEEEALDGKALPMSRREHVVRYLSALRERFETDGE